MLRLNDVHAIALVARAAGVNFVAQDDVCIAHYDSTDKLTSGVLYSGSNSYSAEIHVASFRPNWTNKELLWFTFHYAFNVRKWGKIFGRVPDDKQHQVALEMDYKLGFKNEGYLNDVFGEGIGLFILSMYARECKWLKMKPPKVTFPPLGRTVIAEPEFSWEF